MPIPKRQYTERKEEEIEITINTLLYGSAFLKEDPFLQL